MNFKHICLTLLVILIPATSFAQDTSTAPESFADLAERLLPAVVNVSSTQAFDEDEEGAPELPDMPQFPPGSPFEDFFEDFLNKRGQGGGGGRGNRGLPPSSLGSGFIIDAENGYVVTNNHVIRDADEVRITLHDDSSLPAEIVGRDEKIDIAVLKVDTKKKLTAVPFGDSKRMRVGDWVIAIGNPFGLGGTVTKGIISARQRDINSGPYDDYIQTDASINRGNSGGPMFDLEGNVIGINTAIYSPSGGSVGIGFAIPSALAEPIIDQLIEYGRTRRGWLGVRIQTVSKEIAQSLNLDEARGALVASLTKGGPAEKAKFQPGDIILEFDGKEVENMRALPRIVAETPIDKTVTVKYWRDGKERSTKVEIGELEKAEEDGLLASSGESPKKKAKEEDVEIEQFGFSITALNDDIRAGYNIPANVDGVVVTKIDPRGQAAGKNIREGDVIVELDQKTVTDPKEVKKLIDKAIKDDKPSILFLLNREGDIRFEAMRLR